MRKIAVNIIWVALAVCVCIYFAGCSGLPLKEGGLEISKDTTAGIDDLGVGRLTRQF
ncbi:MAG: hypothetical protein PHI58_04260 [Candidatus Omnitrophica bacterium]|nr:hypothetical protein [Candidatus Omnitrophota bacterium]